MFIHFTDVISPLKGRDVGQIPRNISAQYKLLQEKKKSYTAK